MEDEVKIDAKRERFVRIAERRVNVILSDLEKLSNCANTNNYRYNDADVKKIFGEIEKTLREVKSKFTDPQGRKEPFRLVEN